MELWLETEDAIEWLQNYIIKKKLSPPDLTELLKSENESSLMYVKMFETGIEMILDN